MIKIKLREPFLIVNFKTYPSGTGIAAEKVAGICERLSKATVIAVQAPDIYRCSKKDVIVFAQHIDAVEPGKNTGFITAESVKDAGAKGTLVNHAEHKIPLPLIKKTVERAQQLGLLTVACAATTKEAEEIASSCSPDYIAVEPPELIGGNVSVSKARPEIITDTLAAVHRIKKIPIVCGAGISGKEDVITAVRLGSVGVLVANFVMGAEDKKKAISELVAGLKEK